MTITSLISRRGREAAVVEDFKHIFAEAQDDSHHLTTLLIHQCEGVSFLVSQFADEDKLSRWRSSPAHREMVRLFERDSLRELCTITEPIVRITVPSGSSGPKWKVFISTWIVIYPLLLILSSVLDWLRPELPWAVRLALTSGVLSIASIWVLNPVTRSMTRVWRLQNQQMQVEVLRHGLRD